MRQLLVGVTLLVDLLHLNPVPRRLPISSRILLPNARLGPQKAQEVQERLPRLPKGPQSNGTLHHLIN